MTLRLVKTTDAAFKSLLKNILGRRGTREGKVERRVAEIVTAVQKKGTRVLLRYTGANCKKAGSIAIRSGWCSASASRHWSGLAYMFRAAKHLTPRLF